MKKFFTIISLLALCVILQAQDRTGLIRTGGNKLTAMTWTVADDIATSDSLVIAVTNIQKYMQHQTFTLTLATISGSPSVTITARGKVNASDSWHPIGSQATWTSVANNPVVITSTTAKNYNYFRVSLVGSGAAQSSKVTAFDVVTANVFDIPVNSGTLTISRATSGTVTVQTADNDANAAAVYRAGGSGALTLGASAGTTAIASSDWSISAAGTMAGIGNITSDGTISAQQGVYAADADNLYLNPYKDLHVIDAQVNSASKFSVDSTGAVVAASTITATGGFIPPAASPLIWAQGGSTVLATSGTDTQPTAGSRYWVEVYIPYNVTLTGASYLIGSVGGTDSVVVQLCNSAGVEVATTKTTGATHGALVGTAANLQSVAFTAPYAAVAGKYFLAVQFSGNTCRFRSYPIPGSKFVASSAAGTWNTKADITPGSTFTADKGPIIRLY